jgi:hypothetical protein
MRRLGHSVRFDHRHPKSLLQLDHQLWRKRRGTGTDESERGVCYPRRVFDRTRQHRLMHRRHGGVPRGRKFIAPIEKARRLKTRCARETPTGQNRREQRAHEPVNMKQWHHVKTAIRRVEPQRPGDIARRGHQIRLRQRHHLRPRRRARRMQYQGLIAGLREHGSHVHRGRLEIQRKDTSRFCRRRAEPNHADTERLCHRNCRHICPFFDDQRPRRQVREIKLKLAAPIVGIERRARRTHRDREHTSSHLGTVGQHNRHSVTTRNPGVVQVGYHAVTVS